MTRLHLPLALLVLVGCGGEAPIEAPPATPVSVAPPSEAHVVPPPSTVAAPAPEVAVEEPAPAAEADAGPLPAVVPGEPIVLASTLTVRPARIPTVVLPTAEATRDLHELIADFAGARRCEILLALPTLVSVRCATNDPRHYHVQSAHFTIDAAGPHPIDLLALFREGTGEHDLEAPEEPPPSEDAVWAAIDVTLTPRGLETSVLTRDDYFGAARRSDYVFRTVGYREIAPRARSDRALGVLLRERGLETWPEPDAPASPPLPEVALRSTLVVRPGAVPTVVLADAAHTAALHALMERFARGTEGCRVTIAVATLVVMECSVRVAGREGVQSLDRAWTYFDLAADGTARHVDPSELYHLGMERTGELGPWGLRNGGLTTYRELAPSVRAESALGRALTMAGVTLAPEGSRPSVRVHVIQRGPLSVVAQRALGEESGGIRVSLAGTDEAWLVAPGSYRDAETTTTDALPATTAIIEPACATSAIDLRAGSQPDAETTTLAAGTEVLLVRGSIGEERSDLGEGARAYVVSGDARGWVPGTSIAPSYCEVVALERSRD